MFASLTNLCAGAVLCSTGLGASVSSPDISNSLTAAGMVVAGIIFVVGFVWKEATSRQKLMSTVGEIHQTLTDMKKVCILRGELLAQHVTKITVLEEEQTRTGK